MVYIELDDTVLNSLLKGHHQIVRVNFNNNTNNKKNYYLIPNETNFILCEKIYGVVGIRTSIVSIGDLLCLDTGLKSIDKIKWT